MARPIWTGSINFGLVTIPVELMVAVHEHTIHFHMLTKDGTCRLRRRLVCPETNKEYDFTQTAKGVEIGPEDYVLVDQKEIDRLKPEKGKAMEIVEFFDRDAIDPIYYDSVYYLKPAKDAAKPYKLLATAMASSKKAALARFVMREREYLCAIRVKEEGLVLHTLHYSDEVDKMDDAVSAALARVKISAGELKMASQLIKSMTSKLHLDQFKDEFRIKLQALIEAKVKGKQVTTAPEEPTRREPRTINLMEALKRSLKTPNAKHNGHAYAHARRKSA
jgi:DNA end-binding protein Ku